jgi:hypothetical protein
VSTNRPGRQRVRPLPKGNALFTPHASASRQVIERRSAKPIMYLYQLPRWLPAAVLVILLVVGLSVKGVIGTVALCAVAAILGWLATVSWPRLTASGRAGRLLAIAVLLAAAGYQATR